MKTIRLVGMAHQFGSEIDTNESAESRYQLRPGFILEKTGITQRHRWAPGEDPSAKAARVANEILWRFNVPLPAVRGVFGSSNPYGEVLIPGPTFKVAHELNLPANLKVSQTNYGCGGYFSALEDMWCWLQFQPEGTFAIMVLTDHPTSMVKEYGTAVLFSDAIHVSLWSNDPSSQGYIVEKPWMKMAPGDIEALQVHGRFWSMNGSLISKFASSVPEMVMDAMGLGSLAGFDIVPHQANVALLETLERKYGVPFYKEVVRQHGNPTCSGTMIALEKFIEGNQGTRPILAMGFGDSLSYGAMVVNR
jgi:3-oxoacyl-[acyl-carrier-protein] synthase III